MSKVCFCLRFCLGWVFLFKLYFLAWCVCRLCMVRLDDTELDISECSNDCCLEETEKWNCDGIEAAIPLITKGDWVVHSKRTEHIRGQFHDLGKLCLTLTCVLLCAVFYVICPRCLFGILIFSACLCPWFNSLNISLWLAIILLTMSGWSFSVGAFSIAWQNGS